MNRVAVLCVLLLALLTGQLTLAQGCLPEQEPNDSPVEANPLTDSCISGHLSSGDQDAFSWSLSEEDSRRPWQLELTSVRSQLTNLDVFRVEFTDDGSGVLGYDTLFQLTSPDGRLVTSEPQLFPAGDYTLGLSVSGGEGSYTVALLPGEPLRDFRNDQTAVLEMTAGFNHSGFLSGQQQFDWTIPAELADHLWHLELDAAVGETPTLSIHGPDGSVLQSATASGGGAGLSSLGLGEGVYRLEVRSDSGIIAPYAVRATSQGARTAGQELEPNDSLEQANALTFGEELRGTLASGGDTDFFRFSVDEEQSTRLLELQTGTDEELQVCLLDEHGRDLQCRRGAGARLSDLSLQPGVYGVAINPSDRERDIDYALLLRDAGEPDPLRPTEPNDRFDQAFPLPEQLGVRGQLHGDETDFVSVEITGEPQLWRVQVNGAGAGELQLYNAAGHALARDRSGSGTLRLDNLYLLPGTHLFAVRGRDTSYTLRLLPLGPPDGELTADDDDSADSTPAPTDHGDKSAPETAGHGGNSAPAPEGKAEQEPNDDFANAELLRFGESRIGLLASPEDRDHYRFTLAAPQHVRLTVTPPEDARVIGVLQWGDQGFGRAFAGEDGVISGQEWLPAGEYTLMLYAEVPSEQWYQVTLERLDPFTVPPGREEAYPQWFGRYEEVATESSELNVGLSLEGTDQDTVAAFWPYGQRLELQLNVHNPGSEALELSLDWHASDERWQLELPEQVALAAGGSQTLAVPVTIAPDAPEDPVTLTVRASSAAGDQATAALSLVPDSLTVPVGSHVWYPLPTELLGGLDAAWTGLGAEIVTATPEEETLSARFSMPYLFNGMTPLNHAYFSYAMGDWVAQDTGLSEFTPTVRLAGSEPVELQGFLLNPTTSNRRSAQLRHFAVSVSLDGEEFTEVYRGELSAHQAEQAFVLPESVSARYVRLHLLGNHEPSEDPLMGSMLLGTFKAVTTREAAQVLSGGAGLNIADPAIGGHTVWAQPSVLAHRNLLLTPDEQLAKVRLDFEVEQAEWTAGFHHHRAAQIERLEWLDHPEATNPLHMVELSVSRDSPAGPWTSLGSWDVTGGAPFELTEPVWARYVRFTATGLTPRDTYHLPDVIRIIERAPDAAYGSVVGEWGHYSRQGPFEQLHGLGPISATTDGPNSSADTAAQLDAGEQASGTVQLDGHEAWYRLTVPEGHNHLSLNLSGQPHRGFDFELLDTAGEPVRTQAESTSTQLTISASVSPGDYLLRVFEPPRSIAIVWDTSGSVAGSLPVIYRALETFAMDIAPGREEVNLLPFDSSFLLRDWSGDPLRVLEAIQANPHDSSSSSGETALLQATLALAERPGKKAIIFLTDGAINRDEGLWPALAEVRPHIFASSITSAGDLSPDPAVEQDTMQSYASVNGGHYEYVLSQADFDVSFRRAAAWLRRPSNYSVSYETEQRWANASAWAVPELQRAADQGLIPGVLAGADLTGPVTRAEFAAVAVRVYEALTGEQAVAAAVNPFTDTTDPEVLKAFNTELAVGISPTEFAPDQLLNREQAATILTRVFKKVNLPGWTWATDAEFTLDFDAPEPFADHERISPWASESVYFMAANGIITGTGNNLFAPRAVTPEEQAMGYANATREQALLLAVRLVEGR